MFTDSPNTPTKSKRRAVAKSGARWSDSQKMELIQMYLLTGNLALSAASLKIPEDTARQWKAKNWWKEREHELRIQKDFKISNRLERIVDKSLELVDDRLQHGDFFYNKNSGTLERKPVSLLQAHKVASDMLDRRELLEKKLNAGQTQEVAIDKFVQLAEKFAALAQKTQEKPPVEVTDVIYIPEGEEVPEEPENSLEETDTTDFVPTEAECVWNYDDPEG